MDEQKEFIEQEKTPIGIIFDSINYYSVDDIDKFISNMNNEQALYCLIEAVKSAYKRNTFSLLESEVLSKSLRIITL